jgi:hypothetical protein
MERLWEMRAQLGRALRAPPQEVQGQGDGAEGGLRRERAEPRAGQGQGPFQRRDHGRAGLEGAAGQHHGIGLALEVEPESHGARGQRQLAGAALQQLGGQRIALVVGLLHVAGQGRDAVLGQVALVDARHQRLDRVHVQGPEDERPQQRVGPPPVGRAHGQPQGLVPQPVGRPLVGQQEAVAAGTRAGAAPVAAVGDGARAGQHHDAHAVGGARGQRDGGVVDDARALAMAQPAQDAADDLLVLRPVHARDAQAHGRHLAARGVEGLQDLVQDLLHLQLAVRLEVGPPAAGLGQDAPALVGQQPYRLGPAGVDPDDLRHQPSLD